MLSRTVYSECFGIWEWKHFLCFFSYAKTQNIVTVIAKILVPGFEIANTGHDNNKQLFITILTQPPSCERQYKQTEEKKLERCLYHQVISNVLKKVSVDKTIALANITFSTMAILLKIQLLKVWVGAAWTRVRFSWELVHQLDRQVGLRPGHRQETEEEPQMPVGEQQTSLWWDLPAVLSLVSH